MDTEEGNPGVSLHLHIMCGRGCTLEGGNPGVSLYLCIMCGGGYTLEGGIPTARVSSRNFILGGEAHGSRGRMATARGG